MWIHIVSIFGTFIGFLVLQVVGTVVFFWKVKKYKWVASICLLVFLVLAYIPTAGLVASTVYWMNSYEGEYVSYSAIPEKMEYVKRSVPSKCEATTISFTPTQSWFSCEIGFEDFQSWRESNGFEHESERNCAKVLGEEIALLSELEFSESHATEFAANGAGKISQYDRTAEKMFMCEWYW